MIGADIGPFSLVALGTVCRSVVRYYMQSQRAREPVAREDG